MQRTAKRVKTHEGGGIEWSNPSCCEGVAHLSFDHLYCGRNCLSRTRCPRELRRSSWIEHGPENVMRTPRWRIPFSPLGLPGSGWWKEMSIENSSWDEKWNSEWMMLGFRDPERWWAAFMEFREYCGLSIDSCAVYSYATNGNALQSIKKNVWTS